MSLFQKVLEKLKMLKKLNGLQALREQRGAVFALSALLLPLLFGFMGLGYDVGNLYVHKAKLQDTADATSLAGARGYVNALKGNTTGVVSLPTESADTKTKKENAIIALKENANNYIANNNPVFQDKLNHDNRTEKFYSIGKEVTSPDGNKSIEYFRVVLSEPVQLYFLPVIGIKNSANVNVYATTKLSDNEIVEVAGEATPVDAENKPVVIAGSYFDDLENTVDSTHNIYNNYNVSTVYVETGGNTNAVTIDGKKVVPSKSGNISGRIYQSNTEWTDVTYAEIVETDYNMTLFGDEIKKLFRQKQQDSLSQSEKNGLAQYKADKAQYDIDKAQYDIDKAQYDIDKPIWDQKYAQYLQEYNNWDRSRRIEVYNTLKIYRTSYSNGCSWNDGIAPKPENEVLPAIKQQWINDGKPLTSDWNKIENVIKSGNEYYWPVIDPANVNDEGTFNNQAHYYEGLSGSTPAPSFTDEEPVNPTEPVEPQKADPKYGLSERVFDEYYMTYRGERMDPFRTSSISADPLLSGVEHSFFYLSHSTAGYNSNDTSVTIDGFYINESEGITENTPFYLFIDEDIKLTNFYIENTNRPLILFYNGPYETHYQFTNGSANNLRNYRAFIYAPHNAGDTHINGNYINFKGSIVAEKLTTHTKNSEFQYDVDEIKKWQDEGLPVTPNVGFSSSGGESGGEGNEVETEKITIPDHLRLVLADTMTDESHYNKVKVVWTPVE